MNSGKLCVGASLRWKQHRLKRLRCLVLLLLCREGDCTAYTEKLAAETGPFKLPGACKSLETYGPSNLDYQIIRHSHCFSCKASNSGQKNLGSELAYCGEVGYSSPTRYQALLKTHGSGVVGATRTSQGIKEPRHAKGAWPADNPHF